MSGQVRAVSGNFFTEEQKQAKADIMHALINTYFESFEKYHKLFHHPEMLSDLITSILIMFTRDMLVHYIQTFNLESSRKDVVKTFCEVLRDQVNQTIKASMQ